MHIIIPLYKYTYQLMIWNVLNANTNTSGVEKKGIIYRLGGGFGGHAIFADGQAESIFNVHLQFRTRDSQNWVTRTQAKMQSGAVIRTLWGGTKTQFKQNTADGNKWAHLFTTGNTRQHNHLPPAQQNKHVSTLYRCNRMKFIAEK